VIVKIMINFFTPKQWVRESNIRCSRCASYVIHL